MSGDSSKKVDRTSIRQSRVDQVSALLWLIVGIVVLIGSLDLRYRDEYGPGPGFLPFWLGLGLIFLGLMLLARAIFGRKDKEEDISLPSKYATLQMSLVMVGFFGFVFLGDKVGFLPCIGLMFLFLLAVVERRGWKFSLAMSLISALFFWVVFEVGLKLRLPLGLLDLLR
jgi:putative tricarboxylic transport membrane protein